jgi:diketogulonate reductase-like aldo/keto reductase
VCFQEAFELVQIVKANGAEIPALGFGTSELTGAACEEAVDAALTDGYRHIDTAQMYGNEREVGRAIRGSFVKREEVFLTSKIARDRLRGGDLERSVEDSLERLGTDCIDLILIHWPNPGVPLKETMAALSEVKDRGLARHIGVSNFTVDLLDQAVAFADEPLVVNQVEYHPFLDERMVLAACRKHGLALTAYSPLAQGRVFGSPVLERIAGTHGKTPGQVTLRWLIQQPGVTAIPRSADREHIRQNNDIYDFELSPSEMDEVFGLAEPGGRIIDPEWAPDWDVAA